MELRKTEASVEKFGFQLVDVIVAQIGDQLRSEMGPPNNPRIDDPEQPSNILTPNNQDINIVNTTQGNTTNTLIGNMMANMETMRLRLEQAKSWSVQPCSGDCQSVLYYSQGRSYYRGENGPERGRSTVRG